jgi:hypothetical protein
VVSVGMVSSPLMEYHDAIKECESTLPRNQHCEITATPKENP